jgi:hypothetical protein
VNLCLLAAIASVALLAGCGVDNMVPTATYSPPLNTCSGIVGPGGDICQADNATTSVYDVGLNPFGPTLRNAVERTLNDSYDTTDLVIQYAPSPVVDAPDNRETDIIYRIDEHGTFPGLTYCEDVDGAEGDIRCDQHYVTFTPALICSHIQCHSETELQRIACHETGHAVGLLHGENAAPVVANDYGPLECMKTNQVPPRTLGSANASLIDATY